MPIFYIPDLARRFNIKISNRAEKFMEKESFEEAVKEFFLTYVLKDIDKESYSKLPVFKIEKNVEKEFFDRYYGKLRLFVTAIVKSKEGILLTKNKGRDHGWELVGGKMDDFSPERDIIREVREEVGINLENVRPICFLINVFKLNDEQRIEAFGVSFYSEVNDVNLSIQEEELKDAKFFSILPENIAWGNKKAIELALNLKD